MKSYILYFYLYLSICCLGYHPRFLLQQVHSFTPAAAAAAPAASSSSSKCKQRGEASTNSSNHTTRSNNKFYSTSSRKGIQSVLWKCQQFTNKSKCHAAASSSTSSSDSTSDSITTSSPLLNASTTSSTTTISNRPATITTSSYQWSLTRMALTIASTYFTWHIQQQTNGISNVMASSSIALLCTMLTNNKSISNAVFCGTFAGMSSHTIIPSWNHALLLGIITCAFYERMIEYKNQFVGLGGRLGLMAFVSTWMVVASMTTFSSWGEDNIMTSMVLLPSRLSSFFSSSSSNMFKPSIHPLSTLLPMVFWHVVGSILTIWLRRSSSSDETRTVDPVRAACVVGMAGALLLPTSHKSSSSVASLALYGGSFVGMSAPSRLLWQGSSSSSSSSSSSNDGSTTTSGSTTTTPRRRRSDGVWLAFGMAAALAGVVHGITIDWGLWMGGWGGKAGACAFVGCVLYRCLVTCWMRGVVPVVLRMWNVTRNKNNEEEGEVKSNRSNKNKRSKKQ